MFELFLFDADDGGAGAGAGGAPVEAPPAAEAQEFEIVEDTPEPVEAEGDSQSPETGEAETPEPVVDWKAKATQEREFFQKQLGTMQAELQKMRDAQREAELANLDADERNARLQQYREQELSQREQQLQQQQYASQLAQYYSKFVPTSAFYAAKNPAEAQHMVLTHLASENQRLKKQVEALKSSVKARPVEPVGGGGQPPRNPQKLDIDAMTPEQIEAALARLMTQQETFEDVFNI